MVVICNKASLGVCIPPLKHAPRRSKAVVRVVHRPFAGYVPSTLLSVCVPNAVWWGVLGLSCC